MIDIHSELFFSFTVWNLSLNTFFFFFYLSLDTICSSIGDANMVLSQVNKSYALVQAQPPNLESILKL